MYQPFKATSAVFGLSPVYHEKPPADIPPPPPPPPPPMPPLVNENPIVGDPAGQIPMVHVWDASEQWSLYELNADDQFEYPASCVKLMTVLLAWEYKQSNWLDTVTLVASDCGQPLAGLNLDVIGFAAGDIVTWEQLTSAMLLKSAGDACQAVARLIGEEIVGGEVSATDARIAFVARMNERAVELGIAGTFTDSFGGCKTASPAVTRNVLSARDLTKLCEATFAHSELRTLAQAASNPIVVDGPSPRTLTNDNYSPFMNGPYFNRQGERDTSVLAGKNGVWELDALYHHNCTLIWEAPNGNEIIITTLNSKSPWGCVLDQKGLMYSILKDFPYLWDGIPTDADPGWSNVKVLLGGGLVDESTIGRTVTLTSVTTGDPVIAGSTDSAVFNAQSDAVSFADAADLSVGAANMCVEEWFAGTGAAPPSAEYVFFSKFDSGQKEWAVDYDQGYFQIFASSDGSGQTAVAVMNSDPFDRNVFFNGAPRHIAFVKNGSEWSLWLNGEKMGPVLTLSTAFDGTAPLQVGLSAFGVSALGSVDEFRFTKGSSRYAGNQITITALPFPRAGSPPPPPPPPPP